MLRNQTFQGMIQSAPCTQIDVGNISEIFMGDHIKLKRYIYSHHAIISAVYVLDDVIRIDVIHYASNVDSQHRGKGKIIEETNIKLDENTTMYKINYEDPFFKNVKRFPWEVTLDIARFYRDNNDSRHPYAVLVNNCEHFAFTCTTGYAISYQENNARNLFISPFFRLKYKLFGDYFSSFFSDMSQAFRDRRVVEYDDKTKYFIVELSNGQTRHVEVEFWKAPEYIYKES